MKLYALPDLIFIGKNRGRLFFLNAPQKKQFLRHFKPKGMPAENNVLPKSEQGTNNQQKDATPDLFHYYKILKVIVHFSVTFPSIP